MKQFIFLCFCVCALCPRVLAQNSCGNTLTWTSPLCQQIGSGRLQPWWTVVSRHGEYGQDENDCNTPGSIAQSSGLLAINTTNSSYTCGNFTNTGGTLMTPVSQPYNTGDIQWNTLNFTYGTVIAKIKIPTYQTNTWPSLWFMDSLCQLENKYSGDPDGTTCPSYGSSTYRELDMIECMPFGSSGGGWCELNVHNGSNNPSCSYSQAPIDGTSFHTYQMIWSAGSITTSFDGANTDCSTSAANVPSGALFAIFQTQTAASGSGLNPPTNSQLPTTLQMEFLKVCSTTDGGCSGIAVAGPCSGNCSDSRVLFYDNFSGTNDIYLASSAAGTGDGTSCANAMDIDTGGSAGSLSWFNNSANWGTGSTQISAGTTVHVCGTVTGNNGTSLTFQGSGASGNPITLKFEPGANLTNAGNWGTGEGEGGSPCAGAISIVGKSNIVVDGGGTPNTGANPAGLATVNGYITNTSNSGGVGVYVSSGTDVTIQNLNIYNIHSNSSGSFLRASVDILVDGSNSNVLLLNNELQNSGTAVDFLESDNYGVEMKNNYLNDHCWQIGAFANVNIDGNEITGWTTTAPSGACHTDGVFTNGGSPNIYNNYFHDFAGQDETAFIYCTYVSDPPSGFYSSCASFNNIFQNTYGAVGAQVINGGEGGPELSYNNTSYNAEAFEFWELQGAHTTVFSENNIDYCSGVTSGCSQASGLAGSNYAYDDTRYGYNPVPSYFAASTYSGAGTSDYNNFYTFTKWASSPSDALAAWQTATGLDTHSSSANSNLNSTFPFALTSSSPGKAAGVNLSSLCTSNPTRLAKLCYDRLGNARPASGAWDMGATNYGGSSPPTPASVPAYFTELDRPRMELGLP